MIHKLLISLDHLKMFLEKGKEVDAFTVEEGLPLNCKLIGIGSTPNDRLIQLTFDDGDSSLPITIDTTISIATYQNTHPNNGPSFCED